MTEHIAEYMTARGAKRSFIVPSRSSAPKLVDELAREWVEVAKFNPTAVGTLRIGIFRLASHMTKQIGFDPSRHSIRELRRRHIDSWELTLLEWQARLGSDHPYRVAVYLFAFLRYLEDRRPGRLHPEVYARVCEPTRLAHIRREPLPDFSEDELTRIKTAVRNRTWKDGSWTTRATGDVLVAFHVALCIATGEPPEVLRGLTLNDISATSKDLRSAGMGTEQMAVAGLADSYNVTLRKNRAHRVEEVTWTREREPTTLRYLDALIRLGAPLRRLTRLPDLWMIKDEWGIPIAMPWEKWSFSEWLDRYVAGEISTPHDTPPLPQVCYRRRDHRGTRYASPPAAAAHPRHALRPLHEQPDSPARSGRAVREINLGAARPSTRADH